MLPSIIDVARENQLTFNERSLNKKEVMCKCPFCLADANNPKKFYLSLNPDKNVFKCWYCKEYGGVLQFESLVTGNSYEEVRLKYFGDIKKKYHPAELLSPKQLKAINWDEIKRKHNDEYKRSLENVFADWKAHVHSQRILAFAKLLIGIESKKYQLICENIKKQALDSQVPNLLEDVLEMYSSSEWKSWALEAREIAVSALLIARKENNELANALVYVVFAFSQYNQKNKNDNRRVG
ncbi:hypothetical protein [Robertmurraya massiliosenegalensis]|uniref:hypothetical protein n=1 Tax=Robertmurraya massiliosenegalensis TaxID=1287657 RepID=UPI0002D4D44B|nr:hypothetical protein [Robertmurraya massiliosenegalensis]